jgi:pantothenate kinase
LNPAINECAQYLIESSSDRRWIQGIAGIPGSGKSTFAAALVEQINQHQPAALVAMDGFHLPNQTLINMGRRDFKGAPDTYDVNGYIALLKQLRTAAEPVRVPVYDRNLHEPVPGPTIDPSVRIIITEGNYLLLDQPPWSQLADVLDSCWLINTSIDQARQWAINRHIKGGRDKTDAEQHYERTDLPNAQLVQQQMREPDKII